MTLKVFLELVEIKAKTASILPCLLGFCFAWYHYQRFEWLPALVFFVAMVLFNMAVDMLDNYHDFVHAVDTEDYQQNTNIIGRESLSAQQILKALIVLVVIAGILGLWLVYLVGLPVLWMGIFCFAIGFLYSSGPFPMSGLPVGEFFSGFTMGVMITLISVYVNTFSVFTWSWSNLLSIWAVALANELWISNLLLTNNICDAKEDEDNHRHTIIHFIGIRAGLWAFAIKNALALMTIAITVLIGLQPWTVLATWLLIPFIIQQTRLLFQKQVKKETFSTAVKILFFGSLTQVITFALGILLEIS